MRIKFTKNLTCTNSDECAEETLSKIEFLLGVKLHADLPDESVEGHLSMRHEQNNHTVWVFLYNNDGIHESESHSTKRIVKLSNQTRIKRYTGNIPTVGDIKNAI